MTPQPTSFPGAALGTPRTLLRLDGALALLAGISAYGQLGGSWGWFAALFLLPDLSMLGYLVNKRVGAVLYNTGHSYLSAGFLASLSVALGAPVLLLGASIWAAHIGFDRMMGYGLKYGSAFGDTHLGRVGIPSRARS